jgi:acyl carrier protein
MEDLIITYISQELVNKPEVLPLNNDTSLVESGILDSLSLLKLLLFLEENFHIRMDDVDVVPENFDTVTNICNYIRAQ